LPGDVLQILVVGQHGETLEKSPLPPFAKGGDRMAFLRMPCAGINFGPTVTAFNTKGPSAYFASLPL
jgi:hypothetical protein